MVDKGKKRQRVSPELPDDIWKKVFECYYNCCADNWHSTGRFSHSLTPVLISRNLSYLALDALYAHPHIGYRQIPLFLQSLSVTRSDEYEAELPKANASRIRQLTIRASPSSPSLERSQKFSRADGVRSNGISTWDGTRTVHEQFSELLSYLPKLATFTLKDTLITTEYDMEELFQGLHQISPKKVQLEFRLWDLYASTAGEDIIAATRPNVYSAPDDHLRRGNKSTTSATSLEDTLFPRRLTPEAWRDALHAGTELDIPLSILEPPPPPPPVQPPVPAPFWGHNAQPGNLNHGQQAQPHPSLLHVQTPAPTQTGSLLPHTGHPIQHVTQVPPATHDESALHLRTLHPLASTDPLPLDTGHKETPTNRSIRRSHSDARAASARLIASHSTAEFLSSTQERERRTSVQSEPEASTQSTSSEATRRARRPQGLTEAQANRTDHIYVYPFESESERRRLAANPPGRRSADDHRSIEDGLSSTPTTASSSSTILPSATGQGRPSRSETHFNGSIVHNMRKLLLELLVDHWAETTEALSIVALDPLASVIIRSPALDFWTQIPIPHIRVHLPRACNPLSIFKGSKEITARRNLQTGVLGDAGAIAIAPADALVAIHLNVATQPTDNRPSELLRVVGGDGFGGGLVHPRNRLFEIEVNTWKEMMDNMWQEAGTELPPQVCRILSGEQDWRDVSVGQRDSPFPLFRTLPSCRSIIYSPSSPPSPRSEDNEVEDSDGEVEEESGDDEWDVHVDSDHDDGAGASYDAEAAREQARRVAERRKK